MTADRKPEAAGKPARSQRSRCPPAAAAGAGGGGRSAAPSATAGAPSAPKEIGGPSGPEPTRYGDWEKKGLASDF